MKVADLLLLVGLGLGTIAGVLLAYDALHGPGARFQAEVAKAQYENFKSYRADLQFIYRGNPDEKDLLAREKELNEPQETILSDRASSLLDNYENKAVTITLIGIYLLVAAFLIQFIGTLMDALGIGGHL
jgi:hypothetical protein